MGGGMTAIDVATQVKLLGAENVTIFYRRGVENMNASEYEQEVAQTNGVTIRHWLQPNALEVKNGAISAITMEYTSASGGPLSGTGETVTVEADQVFKAIGQTPATELITSSGITVEKGRIAVDENRKTNKSKVWAGGDCVAGGEDLTVVSVEDGKLAAEDIHKALSA
jgi:glutamate synthase (NADPH/NADH) small chain